MDLTQYSPIPSKQRSNITIGFLDWYCYIPGLKYDMAWASNWSNAYDSTWINMNDMSGYVYVIDMAAAAAVAAVNNRSDILPYTTVHIKRFSDCGPYWPTVEDEFSGHTTGYAISEAAIGIGEKFTDVIGIAGAECDYISLLYNLWDVKRMAMIYQGDDVMSTGCKAVANDVKRGMKDHNIDMVATIKLKGKLTQDQIDYAAIMIKRTEARYLVFETILRWD
ncbi:UNVERIFIED_CONTAM: hypothetical protein HDU68_009789 [Siphonaria sp. JEL0065]|nr:hypothetical protein HDU68_009789 [Siphonaria sp. JEL0065]